MPMEIRINLSTQQAMLIADITAMRFYMISNLCLVETLHAPGACLFVSTTAVSPAYTAASVYTPRLHLLGWGGVGWGDTVRRLVLNTGLSCDFKGLEDACFSVLTRQTFRSLNSAGRFFR